MEVEDGGKARHPWQNQFGATAKAHRPMRIDAANRHLKIGIHHPRIKKEGCAFLQRANALEVARHKVVAFDSIITHDLCAQLLLKFLLGLGAMRTAANNKTNLLLWHARQS